MQKWGISGFGWNKLKGVFVYIKYKQTENYIQLEKELISKINTPLNNQHNG